MRNNGILELLLFFCGTRASHCCGLSCCGAQAPDAQAQQPWLMGPAAPWHVGSSWTGHEPVSPASAGGLSTTVPPWKPWNYFEVGPHVITNELDLEFEGK